MRDAGGSGGEPLRFAVVVFPGSNCDVDAYHALGDVLGHRAEYVWHEETDLSRFDAAVLPGGFSYGDYLRAGAIARFSPAMSAVARFAAAGGPVIGICNGFQILLEAGLLPGAMRRNASLRFRCEWVHLRVEQARGPWLSGLSPGDVLRIPIAHGEGNYFATEQEIVRLEAAGQVALRYCTPDGRVAPEANPNGAAGNIAGLLNPEGNVLGLMPHPERCVEELVGGEDGRRIFASAAAWIRARRREAVAAGARAGLPPEVARR